MQTSSDEKDFDDETLASALSEFVAGVMRSCHQGTLLELIEELELSTTQSKLLWLFDGADGELSLSVAAARLGISPGAASRAVDELVRRDLVSRREAEYDRRVKLLGLTDAGVDLVLKMLTARLDGCRDFVAQLPADDRARLSQALALIRPSLPGPATDRSAS